MLLKCQWREPQKERDAPEPQWQLGTLIDFVCDTGGFIHGIIVLEDGTMRLANYDLIRLPTVAGQHGEYIFQTEKTSNG